MAVALAVLATAGAQNAQATQAAKTQRRPAAATASHAAHRPANSHARRAAATRAKTHSGSQTKISAARGKRTPDEVGRSAGLAIRRQFARRQITRRAAALRAERTRDPRRPKLERVALRPIETHAARGSDSGAAAQADLVRETRQPETDEAQGVDVEAAPTEQMAPGQSAANSEGQETPPGGDEGAATALSQPGEAAEGADFASEKTNDEEASLLMPRKGMPAPLRGSLASLQRQNDRLDAEGLERIENEADLAARIANKLLVPLPASKALTVNASLKENHRYCRPWTAKFLADLARVHEAAFHSPLEVSSAVRTVEYQKRLMETNGNAAPAEGDLVSPHLTGATIDIAKSGLSRGEIAWMRRRLAGLQAADKIDVEEEFKQACFHITVYKSYAPARKAGPATPSKPATRGTRRQTADPADEPEAQGT
jgi:hypothetical protein